MTIKDKTGGMQEPGNAFVDLQAAGRAILSGNVIKAVQLQKVIADNSADLARMVIDAAARSNRDIAQMTLHAVTTGDPIALMTLAPRAAQSGLRETMACANRALQSAQALGRIVAAGPEDTGTADTGPETTTDRADRS